MASPTESWELSFVVSMTDSEDSVQQRNSKSTQNNSCWPSRTDLPQLVMRMQDLNKPSFPLPVVRVLCTAWQLNREMLVSTLHTAGNEFL